jgi:hypothetical protein
MLRVEVLTAQTVITPVYAHTIPGSRFVGLQKGLGRADLVEECFQNFPLTFIHQPAVAL